jgi:hypothetical protein
LQSLRASDKMLVQRSSLALHSEGSLANHILKGWRKRQ